MQAKIYYIMEGVAAENFEGRTILSMDRLGVINSNNLTRFPLLEYLTSNHERPGTLPGQAPQSHKFTKDDFKSFIYKFDNGNPQDPANCEPNENVNKFLWNKVLTSNETHGRIRKVARNMEQLDHDDMYGYMPPLDEEAITDVCQAATGRKKYLTIEGYANVIPGFSQYIRSLGEIKDKKKLAQAIVSYVRFESIMTNKYEKHQGNLYQRLSDQTLYEKGTVVTPGRPPAVFIKQMNAMVKSIANAYAGTEFGYELTEIIEKIYDIEVGDPQTSKEEMKLQKERDKALREFGKVFKKAIVSDKGNAMLNIVNSAKLEGMPYIDDEEKDRNKLEFEVDELD